MASKVISSSAVLPARKPSISWCTAPNSAVGAEPASLSTRSARRSKPKSSPRPFWASVNPSVYRNWTSPGVIRIVFASSAAQFSPSQIRPAQVSPSMIKPIFRQASPIRLAEGLDMIRLPIHLQEEQYSGLRLHNEQAACLLHPALAVFLLSGR
jgi:hypothetical protein